jgi:vacuolar-type H+-ATPase subunit F/Vma7
LKSNNNLAGWRQENKRSRKRKVKVITVKQDIAKNKKEESRRISKENKDANNYVANKSITLDVLLIFKF